MADVQTLQAADREKRLVALSSLIAAVVLTSLKLVVGVATGSLGILSEAAHSGLDLVAAGVTFFAVRIAGQPADREHTYGHGKVENLSALFETVLLLVTCGWIVYEAVNRLLFEAVHVQASVWGFVVMGVSIVIDFSRSRALKKVADKYSSQALEADALHFSTDIWSSSVVIGGLGLVWLAPRVGLPWLEKADAVAAMAVAAIVVYVSLQLGRKSIDDLIDAVPSGMQAQVADAVRRVPGVLAVTQVRVRRSGPEFFADVTVAADGDLGFGRAHDLAHAAEAAVHQDVPNADVVVHVEPIDPGRKGLLSTIRQVAARRELGAHAIRLYDIEDGYTAELHLEVNEMKSLREAHDEVSRFEEELHKEAPEIREVITHIEPTGTGSARRTPAPADDVPVREALRWIVEQTDLRFEPHELKVQRVGGEVAVSFHCALDPELPIVEAHGLTEQLEKLLRDRVPNLGRVVIHVEPPE